MPDGKPILVVDDDDEVRGLLTSILTRRNMVVDEAASGAEALELLKRNRYAVVLLDLVMPNVNGFEVLAAIEKSRMQPVVLIVTGAERAQLGQLDSRSIHGIVRKPFDPDVLGDVVVQCAETRSRAGFETMAVSTMLASIPLLSLLNLGS